MMGFAKFIGGAVAVLVGFVIVVKLLGVLFALIGLTLWLAKMAIYIGVLALICYGIYRLLVPTERRAP